MLQAHRCLDVLLDVSKLALEERRAQLMALAAAQPIRPADPAWCDSQGGHSLIAAAQAAANALALKVVYFRMLPRPA